MKQYVFSTSFRTFYFSFAIANGKTWIVILNPLGCVCSYRKPSYCYSTVLNRKKRLAITQRRKNLKIKLTLIDKIFTISEHHRAYFRCWLKRIQNRFLFQIGWFQEQKNLFFDEPQIIYNLLSIHLFTNTFIETFRF